MLEEWINRENLGAAGAWIARTARASVRRTVSLWRQCRDVVAPGLARFAVDVGHEIADSAALALTRASLWRAERRLNSRSPARAIEIVLNQVHNFPLMPERDQRRFSRILRKVGPVAVQAGLSESFLNDLDAAVGKTNNQVLTEVVARFHRQLSRSSRSEPPAVPGESPVVVSAPPSPVAAPADEQRDSAIGLMAKALDNVGNIPDILKKATSLLGTPELAGDDRSADRDRLTEIYKEAIDRDFTAGMEGLGDALVALPPENPARPALDDILSDSALLCVEAVRKNPASGFPAMEDILLGLSPRNPVFDIMARILYHVSACDPVAAFHTIGQVLRARRSQMPSDQWRDMAAPLAENVKAPLLGPFAAEEILETVVSPDGVLSEDAESQWLVSNLTLAVSQWVINPDELSDPARERWNVVAPNFLYFNDLARQQGWVSEEAIATMRDGVEAGNRMVGEYTP